MEEERRLKMIVILLLKLLEGLLFPLSALVKIVDSALAPLISSLPALRPVVAMIQGPLEIFAYLLGSKDLMVFMFTFSAVLLPIELAISFIWWIVYKIPAFSIKDK